MEGKSKNNCGIKVQGSKVAESKNILTFSESNKTIGVEKVYCIVEEANSPNSSADFSSSKKKKRSNKHSSKNSSIKTSDKKLNGNEASALSSYMGEDSS